MKYIDFKNINNYKVYINNILWTFAFNEHQNSCGACFSPNPRVSYDRFYRILDFSKLNSRK